MKSISDKQLRARVEAAHMAVRTAQDFAYASTSEGAPVASWRVRRDLNRAQSILIKLLVHRMP